MWELMSGMKTYTGIVMYLVVGAVVVMFPDMDMDKLAVLLQDYVAKGLVYVGLVHKAEKMFG